MDPSLQSRLLKVLEDKRVTFESSYFDENAPNVPEYVKRLFREGAPADFVLIGATTREPDDIDPAIRSRCAEVFFAPLGGHQILTIVQGAIRRLGAKAARGVAKLIASYTIEGRKAVQIVADAYGQALYRLYPGKQARPATKNLSITEDDVLAVVQAGRLVRQTRRQGPEYARDRQELRAWRAAPSRQHHRDRSGGLSGRPNGKGTIRFNDTAGTMAKDSVFNATSVLRAIDGTRRRGFGSAHQRRRRRQHRWSVGRAWRFS